MGDAEGPHGDLRVARRDILPQDLLDVVDAVKAARGSHIAVPLLAIRCLDDEVEVVPGASLQTSVILSVRAADAVPTPAVAFLRFFAVFLRFATLRLPAPAETLIVIVSD